MFNINKRGLTFTIIITILTLLVLGTLLLRNNVAVPCDNLQIKSGPNLSYKTIDIANHGEHVQILSHKNQWVRVVYNQKKIGWIPEWLLNNHRLKRANNLSEATIVLDPGHGGSDSGALSTNKKQEKTFTLQFAQKTAKRLRKSGANVIMVRNSDKTVSLFKRPSFSADNHASLFVSFHFDSSPDKNTASGFTSYYYHQGKSKQLATDINHNLNNLSLTNRGVMKGDFLVIRDVTVPSVLLEMGYINNDDDFKLIKNNNYQKQVSKDVTSGINNYINQNY